MKKIISLLLATHIISFAAFSQGGDEETKPDVFKSPSSPAASLLRFATSDIEKPSDLSAFMVSLQSATSSFSKLPSNYAIDLSPYWLLRTKTDFTTTGLDKTDFKNIFKQTFVVSIGVRSPDSSFDDFKKTSAYTAVGFKFSLFRPEYSEDDKKALKNIHIAQTALNSNILAALNKPDSLSAQLKRKKQDILKKLKAGMTNIKTDEERARKLKSIEEDEKSELYQVERQIEAADSAKKNSANDLKEKLSKAVKEFEGKRVGFSWDVAGGVSSEFREKRFDNSKLYNAGLWTTLGWANKSGNFNVLGQIRYLYNPDKAFLKENKLTDTAGISNFDVGFRCVYSILGNKGNLSLEGMYRYINAKDIMSSSTWRMIFNADYEIRKNQKLNFSFGKEFDGTIVKSGNLVAALTLITGLGNKKIDTPKSK